MSCLVSHLSDGGSKSADVSFGLTDRGPWDPLSLTDENCPIVGVAAFIISMSKRTRLACRLRCPSSPIATVNREGRTWHSYSFLTRAYPAWLISLFQGHFHLTTTKMPRTLGGWLECVAYGISISLRSWILALSTSRTPVPTSQCTPRL